MTEMRVFSCERVKKESYWDQGEVQLSMRRQSQMWTRDRRDLDMLKKWTRASRTHKRKESDDRNACFLVRAPQNALIFAASGRSSASVAQEMFVVGRFA